MDYVLKNMKVEESVDQGGYQTNDCHTDHFVAHLMSAKPLVEDPRQQMNRPARRACATPKASKLRLQVNALRACRREGHNVALKSGGKAAGRPAAAALTVALLTPVACFAESATLLDATVCQDPVSSFNYRWASTVHHASALFCMKRDGTVEAPSTASQKEFNTYDSIYIVAHGQPGKVGDFAAGQFAQKFKDAHPSTPTNIFFCRLQRRGKAHRRQG